MTTSRYQTAQSIMDRAAIECGLAAPGSGVYSSTDANAVLLRNLLDTCGQELALMAEWPALVKEHTITSDGSGSYALPADFNGLVDETPWDRTQVYSMAPVTPRDWQYDQAIGTASTWSDFRIQGDAFKVASDTAGNTLAFEYRSRYWAKAAASASPDKAACTVATDVVYFEPVMVVALLKLRFKEARGEDTLAATVAFERRFDAALSAEVAAPVLDLARG